ncbi:MAG: nucleotide exchange factor GrpE, partial [Desulfoferrobacter sp.]
SSGIQMVRQRNVPFDERLHEAIENMSPGKLKLQVLDMVQAGYTCNGRVVRAARVIVGNDGSNSDDGDIYESETEDVTRHAENNLRD